MNRKKRMRLPERSRTRRKSLLKSKAATTGNLVGNFASSVKFVTAVNRIYNQEIVDIDRFVKFADTYANTSSK